MNARAPVDTPYGKFSICWRSKTWVKWRTLAEVGLPELVPLLVPDRGGAPDPSQLERIPDVLDLLPILLAKAAANSDSPEDTTEANLSYITLSASVGDGEDISLGFIILDGMYEVLVNFCGDKYLGTSELAL
jgi:hypothetical protein